MIKKSSIIRLALTLAVITVLATAHPARAGQEKTFKVKVSAEQANLRERPDISSAVVQQIPEGTILDAEKKEGEWYLVRYTLEDGAVISGYIHESLVVVLEPVKVPGHEQTITAKTPQPYVNTDLVAHAYGSAPFELSFSAGGASIDPEDVNLSGQGLAGYNGASVGIAPSGSIAELRFVYSLTAEASYRVRPWLAVGVGIDYLSGSHASTVGYPGAGVTDTFETRPAVRMTPVRAFVRFYPGSGFYFRGSLGYYSAKVEYYYRFDQAGLWQQWSGTAKGHCFGAEVGIGGDWTIARGLALFGEAGFRMARVGGLSGSDIMTDSTGLSVATAGPLWYFTKQGADTRAYDVLFIRAAKPSEAGVVDARRADLNLSGTTFRAGIRLRF